MLRPRMIVADSEPQPTIHVRSAALTLSTMLRTCYPHFSQRCIFCDTVVCRYLNIFSAVTWTHGTASGKSQEPQLEYLSLARSFCRYHFDGTARPFFEGWYFKVAIPECRQSFCFMYSVENPLFRDGMSDLDKLVHGPRFTGVGAQILGADDKYICQFSEKSNNFWGSKLLLQSLCSFLLFYLTLLF